MKHINLFSMVVLLIGGCATIQTGPDLNLRLYNASQKIGEQLAGLTSLKKSQDKVLVLNVSDNVDSKFAVADLYSIDKTREIDGQVMLPSLAVDAIEDGIISSLVNKGFYVIGLKLDPSSGNELPEGTPTQNLQGFGGSDDNPQNYGVVGLFKKSSKVKESKIGQVQGTRSGASANELIYVSARTLSALKGLKAKYQFTKILTYRILTYKKPTSKMGYSEKGYTETKVRMHVRVIDPDSGIVLHTGLVEGAY